MRIAVLPWFCLLSFLSACSGWPSGPLAYNPGTSIPTRTPRIQTVTPIVLSPTPLILTPAIASAVTPSETITPTAAATTETPTVEPTPTPGSLSIEILGCDTGVDVLHGMGEVTNAYVTIRNATGADIEDICATLRGLDEARQHPDKTKCFASLPAGYLVTLKLTVDTTYKAATAIQVDVTSAETLLVRTGEPACQAIGVLLPGADELGIPRPIPTP